MKIAFIADEITSFVKDHDSTWALILAAHESGDEVFYAHSSSLCIDENKPFAQLISLDNEFFRFQAENDAKLVKFPVIPLDENPNPSKYPCQKLYLDDMDIVFMRKDPPVDEHYQAETQILSLCKKAYVTNRPSSLLHINEKLSILNFPDLIVKTIVTNSIDDIKAFINKNGKTVVKPLNAKGGEGIFVLDKDDKNLSAILETSLNLYQSKLNTNLLMVQKYIPEIVNGDKRVILFDGEPVGALLRVPDAKDNRGNLAAGASFAKAEINDRDREIAEKIKPFLKENGIDFAGIDIIGDYLTEINVTSPTCLHEINRLNSFEAEEKLEFKLLKLLKARLSLV